MNEEPRVRDMILAAFSARPVPPNWIYAEQPMSAEEADMQGWNIVERNDDASLFVLGQVLVAVADNVQTYRDACETLLGILNSCPAASMAKDGNVARPSQSARDLLSKLSKEETQAVIAWLQFMKPYLHTPFDGWANQALASWRCYGDTARH